MDTAELGSSPTTPTTPTKSSLSGLSGWSLAPRRLRQQQTLFIGLLSLSSWSHDPVPNPTNARLSSPTKTWSQTND